MEFSKKTRIGIFIALIIAIIIFPHIVDDNYITRVATLCLMYSALAISLNLVSGFMGQVSLGHAGFLGIGAYTSAILSAKFELPFLVTALIAILMAALFGLIVGIPSLKLSGSYLAVVTLGFSEVVRLIELNWVSLTRGPMGITGIDSPIIFGIKIKSPESYYYLALVLLLINIFFIGNIINSHIGRAIMAIREDAVAASSMGINVFKYKVIVFVISAAFTGLMGAFYAHYMRFIDPSAFNFEQSTGVLGMVILGGMGSLPGSIIGATALSIIPEVLRQLSETRMLVYGLVIVFMTIFKPKGICGNTSFKSLLGLKKKYAVPDEPDVEKAFEKYGKVI